MSANTGDFADFSMLDLFKIEVENHCRILENGLVDVEGSNSSEKIEPLMRAAHSIKGAARIVGLDIAVVLAHAMEDVLSAAQHGKLVLKPEHIDVLLQGNDLFQNILNFDVSEIENYLTSKSADVDSISILLKDILEGKTIAGKTPEKPITKPEPEEEEQLPEPQIEPVPTPVQEIKSESKAIVSKASSLPSSKDRTDIVDSRQADKSEKSLAEMKESSIVKEQQKTEDTFVRVLSSNLNKMMGLAGESLVQARSIKPFSTSLLKIKDTLLEMNSLQEYISSKIVLGSENKESVEKYENFIDLLDDVRELLNKHTEDFEKFSRRMENVTERLYNEALSTRMKPFSEGMHGFKRMVRDLAKTLGKNVEFEILGAQTKVDRDILEKLESPLTHLLRNAIDHGIEFPDERISRGKSPEGRLTLEARHRSGMLIISIKDDGKGIDPENLRLKIVERGYTSEEMAANMTNVELMEFLFLPGFSTANKVTEISGRGVGLDVVFSMVTEVGGTVRAESQPGNGTTFLLQLPLTLSVLRTLLVDINSEYYALPLSRIDRIIEIENEDLLIIEDRQYCVIDNENIGIIDAQQVFHIEGNGKADKKFHIIIISDRINKYGIAVDKFLGERDLVVIPLDSMLGRIPNISAGAILEDGSPVLILDIEDLVRSVDNIITQEKIKRLGSKHEGKLAAHKKKILVVDDSLTVREVERKLLLNRGYDVTVAVDGIDGWNAAHRDAFDLIISDVDMPRMNGIELVLRLKADSKLKDIPVMIVSYKDREEDKMRGLEAGANYYLTKSSFHDETLVAAVRDLIGEA